MLNSFLHVTHSLTNVVLYRKIEELISNEGEYPYASLVVSQIGVSIVASLLYSVIDLELFGGEYYVNLFSATFALYVALCRTLELSNRSSAGVVLGLCIFIIQHVINSNTNAKFNLRVVTALHFARTLLWLLYGLYRKERDYMIRLNVLLTISWLVAPFGWYKATFWGSFSLKNVRIVCDLIITILWGDFFIRDIRHVTRNGDCIGELKKIGLFEFDKKKKD